MKSGKKLEKIVKEQAGHYQIDIRRENDYFVAHFPEMNVSAYGSTIDESVRRLKHVVYFSLSTIEQIEGMKIEKQDRWIKLNDGYHSLN